MTTIEIWLALAVVFGGLWSGLLLTVTTILHPIYARRDARGFREELGRFLPVARTSPTNYVCVVGLVVAPAAALVALRGQASTAPFVLTAVGLGLTVIGPLLTSRLLAEPNYEVILGWDPDHVPADWEVARRRYFALNWMRGGFTWAAFACFLAAAYAHLA
jgi:hypothetical protein